MAPSHSVRLMVVSLAVICSIGAVDASISREWDLLVVLMVALGLSLALVGRLESRRPAVPIRRDLVAWLRDRSGVSGESIGVLADRALADYRERYGQAPAEPIDARR